MKSVLLTASLLLFSTSALAELKVKPSNSFDLLETQPPTVEEPVETPTPVRQVTIEEINRGRDNLFERLAPRIEPYLMYQHLSDIMRGPPFYMHDERYDPTNDFFAVGVQIQINERWELDLAHGYKCIDCFKDTQWQTGTQLAIKFFPLRQRF